MTKPIDYIPARGDIIWLNLDPREGHEQSGHRPALVLSYQALALRTNLIVVCPITSKIKGFPYEIPLARTATHGAVLPIHIKSLDFRHRQAKYIEKAPKQILQKTIMSVKLLFEDKR